MKNSLWFQLANGPEKGCCDDSPFFWMYFDGGIKSVVQISRFGVWSFFQIRLFCSTPNTSEVWRQIEQSCRNSLCLKFVITIRVVSDLEPVDQSVGSVRLSHRFLCDAGEGGSLVALFKSKERNLVTKSRKDGYVTEFSEGAADVWNLVGDLAIESDYLNWDFKDLVFLDKSGFKVIGVKASRGSLIAACSLVAVSNDCAFLLANYVSKEKSNPSGYLVMHEMFNILDELGIRKFDLGDSSYNSGSFRFKKKFCSPEIKYQVILPSFTRLARLRMLGLKIHRKIKTRKSFHLLCFTRRLFGFPGHA